MNDETDLWLDGFTGKSKPGQPPETQLQQILREEVLQIHSRSEEIDLRPLPADSNIDAKPIRAVRQRRRRRWVAAVAASVCLSVIAGWVLIGIQPSGNPFFSEIGGSRSADGFSGPGSSRILRGHAGVFVAAGKSIAEAEADLKKLGLRVIRSQTTPQTALLVTVEKSQIDSFRDWARDIDASPQIAGTYLIEFLP